MALWLCKRCKTTFAVGLRCCPHCTGEDVEEFSEMPKITKHGGATNAAEAERPPTSVSAAPVEVLVGEHGPELELPVEVEGTVEVMDGEPAEGEQVGEGLPVQGDEVEVEPGGYDEMSKPDLQKLLGYRELPTSGNKPELIARLREDDAANADEAGE